MALLEDFFKVLQDGQTPWAQEALRRMSAGQDIGNVDADLAERKPAPRQAAPAPRTVVDRQAPPPDAQSDPFRGPARMATVEDIDSRDPRMISPQDIASRAENLPAGGQMAPQAPMMAPQVPAAQARSAVAPARAEAGPDFSTGIGDVIGKAVKGATGLDMTGNDARMRQLTYETVLARTGSKQNAELAARDPRIFQAMLPTLSSAKDQWKIEKVGEDENGRAVYAQYNPRTREMKPVTMGGLPTIPAAVTAAQAAPSAAPATAVADPQALQRPVQAAPQPTPGVNAIEFRKKAGQLEAEDAFKKKTEEPADRYKLQDIVASIDSSWRAADEVKKHPGFDDIAGRALGGEVKVKGVGVDLADLYPGTAQADAFNKHKNLVAKAALTTMERLKQQSTAGATGFGALNAKELEVIENSIATLKLSSSKEELSKSYEKFQEALLGARERAIERFKGKYGDVDTGVRSKQSLFDGSAFDAMNDAPTPYTRPRRLNVPFTGASFDIPFTKVKPE